MDKVEITITAKAMVPAKYAPLIQTMMATDEIKDAFQQMADEMIKMARIAAANAGIEVDELISEATKEQKDAA